MDVPLKWLARYVDWNISVEELAHRLSMAPRGSRINQTKRQRMATRRGRAGRGR